MNPKTKEVLTMKANGLLVKQIASKLNVHSRTVEWHIGVACCELKALNSSHAIAIAVRDGLILVAHVGCIAILCWSSLFSGTEARRGPNPPPVARTARRDTII
tara:strand:+ start:1079 stop:1387 length:309 start_codon:yes stop_codon:yes gene_type:complete